MVTLHASLPDTGWRNINSLVNTAVLDLHGVVLLRRRGDRVTLMISDCTSITTGTIVSVPTGFRLRGATRVPSAWPAARHGLAPTAWIGLAPIGSGTLELISGAFAYGGALCEWPCFEVFPDSSAWPGTPA